MKLSSIPIVCALVACGGGAAGHRGSEPAALVLPEEAEDAPAPRPAEEEVEPIPPMAWSAEADLTPVKGVKMKPVTLTFHQVEGEGVQVTSTELIDGLAPGIYHVVVHAGTDCGKNAAKIGGLWPATAGVAFTLTVEKGLPAELDDEVDYMLTGDDSIVGRTITLHADKKGKLGKVAACGAVIATGGD